MKKLIVLFLLPLLVSAASISISGNLSISPGDTLAIPIIVSDTNKIYGAQINFELESKDFELLIDKTSSTYLIPAISKNPYGITVMAKTGSVIKNKGTLAKIYVKAKSSASVGVTATLKLKNIIFTTSSDGKNFNDTKVSDYKKTLTVSKIKSTDNYLKTLEIEGVSLDFKEDVTTYEVTLKNDFVGSTLKVQAETSSNLASVKIDSEALKEGDNTVTITVTSEAGTKRVYQIKIVVSAPVQTLETNLKNLTVKGYNLGFKADKTDYILKVAPDVEEVTIEAALEFASAKKSITGPDKLEYGLNTYEITVTDTAENKKVYTLTIYREQKCESCQCEEVVVDKSTDQDSSFWKIMAIILIVVALSEMVYMATMREKKQI